MQVSISLDMLNHWHWLFFGVILATLEILVGASFFLLWLGGCAASIAVVLFFWPDLTWQYQVLIFAIESVGCLVFWRWYLKNTPNETDRPTLNQRSAQYIGRFFTLTEPIVNGLGKVKVDDTTWRIEGPDLPVGSKIKVIGVDGVILKIAKRDD